MEAFAEEVMKSWRAAGRTECCDQFSSRSRAGSGGSASAYPDRFAQQLRLAMAGSFIEINLVRLRELGGQRWNGANRSAVSSRSRSRSGDAVPDAAFSRNHRAARLLPSREPPPDRIQRPVRCCLTLLAISFRSTSRGIRATRRQPKSVVLRRDALPGDRVRPDNPAIFPHLRFARRGRGPLHSKATRSSRGSCYSSAAPRPRRGLSPAS